MKQNITILGSTGSIGTNTLDVLSRHLDLYQVFALTASVNVEPILAQCVQYKPRYVVMAQESAGRLLADRVKAEGLSVEVLWGPEALDWVASHEDVHAVMAAIVGAAGCRLAWPLPMLANVCCWPIKKPWWWAVKFS